MRIIVALTQLARVKLMWGGREVPSRVRFLVCLALHLKAQIISSTSSRSPRLCFHGSATEYPCRIHCRPLLSRTSQKHERRMTVASIEPFLPYLRFGAVHSQPLPRHRTSALLVGSRRVDSVGQYSSSCRLYIDKPAHAVPAEDGMYNAMRCCHCENVTFLWHLWQSALARYGVLTFVKGNGLHWSFTRCATPTAAAIHASVSPLIPLPRTFGVAH